MSAPPPEHRSVTALAQAIAALPADRRSIAAVDGVDGAGKTTFADQLAAAVPRPEVRASCDDFHHPRAHRYRRGRESPEGYYVDSFDHDALARRLLEPFAARPRRARAAAPRALRRRRAVSQARVRPRGPPARRSCSTSRRTSPPSAC